MTEPSNPQQPTREWQPLPLNDQIPAQRRGEPPNDGAPPAAPKLKRKKWPWFAAGAVVILVIIIATATSGGGGSTPTASPTAQQPSAFEPPAAAPLPVPATEVAAPTTVEPQPASPPTTNRGRGDDVITITKDSGPAIVQFDCPHCTSNTVLETDGADSLLVNTIGAYTGKHLIDVRSGSDTSTLTIKATGSWTLTVSSGLSAAKMQSGTDPVSGEGDDVVLMRTGTTTKAHITNRGESNFAVWVYPVDSGFPDLAVNEIGEQ